MPLTRRSCALRGWRAPQPHWRRGAWCCMRAAVLHPPRHGASRPACAALSPCLRCPALLPALARLTAGSAHRGRQGPHAGPASTCTPTPLAPLAPTPCVPCPPAPHSPCLYQHVCALPVGAYTPNSCTLRLLCSKSSPAPTACAHALRKRSAQLKPSLHPTPPPAPTACARALRR